MVLPTNKPGSQADTHELRPDIRESQMICKNKTKDFDFLDLILFDSQKITKMKQF